MTLNKLKQYRLECGYTQDKMVELLGLKHKSHYCQIENGTIKPSLDIAKKISVIFKRSIEEIFFEDEVHEARTQKSIQAS